MRNRLKGPPGHFCEHLPRPATPAAHSDGIRGCADCERFHSTSRSISVVLSLSRPFSLSELLDRATEGLAFGRHVRRRDATVDQKRGARHERRLIRSQEHLYGGVSSQSLRFPLLFSLFLFSFLPSLFCLLPCLSPFNFSHRCICHLFGESEAAHRHVNEPSLPLLFGIEELHEQLRLERSRTESVQSNARAT